MTRRTTADPTIRISRRAVRIGIAVAAGLLSLLLLIGIAAAARANEPVTVASPAQMKVQQSAVERDVEFAWQTVERAIIQNVMVPAARVGTRVEQLARIDAGPGQIHLGSTRLGAIRPGGTRPGGIWLGHVHRHPGA